MVLTIPVGVPYSALQKIVLPFGRHIWMSVCAILIVVILAIYILKCFKWYNRMDHNPNNANTNPIFDIINIFLGASIARMVLNNYLRCIFAVWMLSTLVLRNAYQGSLFNFLQAQIRTQAVDTIAKIIEYNYTLYATPVISYALSESTPGVRNQLSIVVNFQRWRIINQK